MTIIDGKNVASKIEEAIQQTILQEKIVPGLTFFLVGDDPASHTYVAMKKKACKRVGIRSKVCKLAKNIRENDLLRAIALENKKEDTHAILVQMPLPSHISPDKIMESIAPNKDVDGFHPSNMGKTLLGQQSGLRPCTPAGICKLLETLPVSYQEKHALIVGRSNIVGKPLAAMLLQKTNLSPASITVVHSQTQDLKEHTKRADLLIVAVGKAHLIKEFMVKQEAIVIDVGISTLPEQKKLMGDVDFANVQSKASYITPVPGGVGPMTVAMLLQNTLSCYRKQSSKSV